MILKNLRVKKGLVQNQVANKIGVSLRQYQRIEAGTSFPKKDSINALEDMFELPQRVLLAKSVEEVPNYLKNYTVKL